MPPTRQTQTLIRFFRRLGRRATVSGMIFGIGIGAVMSVAVLDRGQPAVDADGLAAAARLRQSVHLAQMRAADAAGKAAAMSAESERLVSENARLRSELDDLRRAHGSLVGRLQSWSSRFVKQVERAVAATGVNLGELLEAHRRESRPSGGPFIPAEADMLAAAPAGISHALGRAAELHGLVERLPLSLPLAEAEVSSPYGIRRDPFTRRVSRHAGIDFAARRGTPVIATGPGLVASAGREKDYGLTVEIAHQAGLATRYAHLQSISVKAGDRVATGQVIGRVGSTGRSTGPHLHYEVKHVGRTLDPGRFVTAGEKLGEISPRR